MSTDTLNNLPDDIMRAAEEAFKTLASPCYSDCAYRDEDHENADMKAIARAIWAERQRCAKVAASLPLEYGHDGALMHVENMTAGRIAQAILKGETE